MRRHMPPSNEPPDDWDPEKPVELVIDGVLDLHPFRPQDLKPLIHAYFEACQEKGITQVLLIHGKGTGAIRKSVQSILKKHPEVVEQRVAEEKDGGWGATWAMLSKRGGA